jgi:hypothetical protein
LRLIAGFPIQVKIQDHLPDSSKSRSRGLSLPEFVVEGTVHFVDVAMLPHDQPTIADFSVSCLGSILPLFDPNCLRFLFLHLRRSAPQINNLKPRGVPGANRLSRGRLVPIVWWFTVI